MNSSTILLAAIEYTVLSHIAIFVMALAIAILPVTLVSHLAAKSNKERRRRYEAQVQADERFHTILRELNQREAETRAQRITVVMRQSVPAQKPVLDTSGRRRFLPLNPQQGCVS
jgi:uncharacterized membrane protein YbaN (DUF454 family)